MRVVLYPGVIVHGTIFRRNMWWPCKASFSFRLMYILILISVKAVQLTLQGNISRVYRNESLGLTYNIQIPARNSPVRCIHESDIQFSSWSIHLYPQEQQT